MEEQVKYTLDELKQKLIQLTMDYIDLRGRGNDTIKERLMLIDIKAIQLTLQLADVKFIDDCTNCDNGSLEEYIKCPICESDIFSPQCLRHREIILKNFKSDL